MLDSVCDQVAARHDAGDSVVLVTSGAIARGMRADGPADAALGDGRAAGGLRGRAGASSTASTTTCCAAGACRAPRCCSRSSTCRRARHYLNARQTLRAAARLARGAGDQRERHDHHRRDLVRRQRLPGRAGGDPARRRPAACCSPTPTGCYTADPRGDPAAELVRARCATSRSSRRCRSACPPRRSARAACARRWWRPRWPRRRASRRRSRRHRAARRCRALRGRARGHALPAAGRARVSSFKLWLKYAKPSHGRLVVDDGAERALRERGTSLLPVGVTACEGEFEAGDAVEVTRRRAPDRQGHRELLGRASCAGQGHEDRRGARAAAAREPRRPFTATTSSWSRPMVAG